MYEDHKTFIPGVGLLVTSWDGSESFIVPAERFETAEDTPTEDTEEENG